MWILITIINRKHLLSMLYVNTDINALNVLTRLVFLKLFLGYYNYNHFKMGKWGIKKLRTWLVCSVVRIWTKEVFIYAYCVFILFSCIFIGIFLLPLFLSSSFLCYFCLFLSSFFYGYTKDCIRNWQQDVKKLRNMYFFEFLRNRKSTYLFIFSSLGIALRLLY